MAVNDIKDTTHRFTDIADPPGVMLAPIEGYNQQPLVSLEEATKRLESLVPRLSTKVYVVKIRAENPVDNLSVDQSAAIALYTLEWQPYTESLYYILNNTLRSEDRNNLKPWFRFLKLILTALSHLPSQQLIVYRGIRCTNENEYQKYRVGADVIWWGFSSCSMIQDISEKDQFLGQTGSRILFVIDCINGKDIGNHSYFKTENEVLLLPATKFRVTNCENRGQGLYVVHLREIRTPHVLLEPVSPKEETTKPIIKLPSKINVPLSTSKSYVNARLDEYIARYQRHTDVILKGKRLNENDMEIIVRRLIIEQRCPGLYISESGVRSLEVNVICQALYDDDLMLERLFLSQNKLGDEGARILAKSLSNQNNTVLKQLCLGDNDITDTGAEHFAIMLESNNTLTHLLLHSNKIRDRGLQRLADALTYTNRTLQVLSLEKNKFTEDSGVRAVLNMLRRNQSLKELNLNSCRMSRSANAEIRDEVAKKPNFQLIIN